MSASFFHWRSYVISRTSTLKFAQYKILSFHSSMMLISSTGATQDLQSPKPDIQWAIPSRPNFQGLGLEIHVMPILRQAPTFSDYRAGPGILHFILLGFLWVGLGKTIRHPYLKLKPSITRQHRRLWFLKLSSTLIINSTNMHGLSTMCLPLNIQK